MYQTGIGAVKAAAIPALFSGMLAVAPDRGHATEFNAGVVMTEMSEEERFTFVAGIVEGLAYARYVSDGNQPEGMACIYDWFYEDSGNIDRLYQAFEAFPEHFPGAVVAAVLNRDCGE